MTMPFASARSALHFPKKSRTRDGIKRDQDGAILQHEQQLTS
jgi:hypothetical protein